VRGPRLDGRGAEVHASYVRYPRAAVNPQHLCLVLHVLRVWGVGCVVERGAGQSGVTREEQQTPERKKERERARVTAQAQGPGARQRNAQCLQDPGRRWALQ
jgi:hypothetical protein